MSDVVDGADRFASHTSLCTELASSSYSLPADSKEKYLHAFNRLFAAADDVRDREEYYAVFLGMKDLKRLLWIVRHS